MDFKKMSPEKLYITDNLEFGKILKKRVYNICNSNIKDFYSVFQS